MASYEKRTGDGGRQSWRARVRVGGAAASATFATKAQARAWAVRVEADMRAGRYRAPTTQSFTDLVRVYEEREGPRLRDWGSRAGHLAWWSRFFGSASLGEVTRERVVEGREVLLSAPAVAGRPRSPATVVRYLATLSHALGRAVEWGWVPDNPAQGVRKPSEPQGRSRYLDRAELARLLDACGPELRRWVRVAALSGMRQGELAALRWRDVDPGSGRLVLERTKNGDRRVVSLGPAALEALGPAGEPEALVFGAFPRPEWSAAVERAGLDGLRFHDLRHTAASHLAMSGATPLEIAEVLGHRTLQMVRRYAHLSPNHTGGLVARLEDALT